MTRDGSAHAMRLLTVPLLAALAAGCGSGGGDGGTSNTGPGDDTGDDGTMLVATFESIQQNVFSDQCEMCHTGASAPEGLRLDPANSYDLLVGVPSSQQPSLQRVDPGNPDDSYLIRKLEGTAATGEQMPLSLPPLPQADIAVIRQWITDGAQPTMPDTPPSEPIRVSSMSPLPGSSESMLPMTIMAMFDRELNATSVSTATFTLERSGGDGTFGDGNEVAITPDSVMVAQANSETAVMDLGSVQSLEDTYRVTLAGSGPTVIQDLDANALDGEFSGSFPSGDDTAGGDFTAEFEVAGIQPNLSSIQDNVFTPTCSGCHTGTGGALPGSMDLTDADASFASLVGVASVQEPGTDRVAAGDADASYLIDKLEGTQSAGVQMPAFGTPLDQATIDTIRQWIDDGAAMP